MHSCHGESCFPTASHEFRIQERYLSGMANGVTDMLSRWDIDYWFFFAVSFKADSMSIIRQKLFWMITSFILLFLDIFFLLIIVYTQLHKLQKYVTNLPLQKALTRI